MASIDFPNSPAVNDVFTAGNSSYRWTGAAWVSNNLAAITWESLSGKPTEFPPEDHTHVIADTTGLQTALDGKASTSHTHVKANITDFAHTHLLADITDYVEPAAARSGWQTIALSGASPDVTLTVSSVLETRLTGTVSGAPNGVPYIYLPDCTTLEIGDRFIIRNNTSQAGDSLGNISLRYSGGGGTSVGSGAYELICIDNTTAGTAGNWQRIGIPNGNSATGTGNLVLATEGAIAGGTLAGMTETVTASTGNQVFDIASSSFRAILSTAANVTVNVRWDSTRTLASKLAVSKSVTIVLLMKNGATAYYPTSWAIDGTAFTPKWLGGTVPSAGNANAVDLYTMTIYRTGTSTYECLGSVAKFV